MITIKNTNEYVNIGGTHYLKNPVLKWHKASVTPSEFLRDHLFYLYSENGESEIKTGIKHHVTFHGIHGTTPSSSNKKGVYTDGETSEVDVLDDSGSPTGEKETALVNKPLIELILGGGNPKDKSINVITFGWADYVNSSLYFSNPLENPDDVVWNPNIATQILTIKGLISNYNETQIAAIQEYFLWMAREAVLERLTINGKTLKELGFYFE